MWRINNHPLFLLEKEDFVVDPKILTMKAIRLVCSDNSTKNNYPRRFTFKDPNSNTLIYWANDSIRMFFGGDFDLFIQFNGRLQFLFSLIAGQNSNSLWDQSVIIHTPDGIEIDWPRVRERSDYIQRKVYEALDLHRRDCLCRL